jgi:hypothetical protein
MLDKKYTGMITKDGVLHLYASAEDLRKDMTLWGKNWSQCAWLEGVEFHEKEQASD